ncbi:MAG: insulinase family protein [Victivallales bacterium]|nr:insulinase family protein [Victivallales bacterium]
MSFKETEHRYLEHYRTNVRIFQHDCGMQVISLENDDAENMFSLGFSTTPENHTGVTHILEHSALAGSGKYPVKEPFMEMIKGSVATFINALTYQDHTVYPASSTVKADYFNLFSVYFDAVFNPLLTENIFKQEGWHLEFEKPGNTRSALKVNGIVYNEMRGYMAELDEVIAKETYSRLLSKSPRRFVSGGLPQAIPSLSYAAFKKYYRNHYHPSVAKVFLYGNIPTQEKLDFLEKCLGGLSPEWLSQKVEPEKPRPIQPRWDKPRKAKVHFMPALDAEKDSAAWARAYLLEDHWEPLLDMSFDFLEYLLLGNSSSPLKKAIIESGLCGSLAISGFDDETPETNFILAVNGIKPTDFAKMEKLVETTLEQIAQNGFTEEQVHTAFMQYKASQQVISKRFVFKQMEKVFDVWCYGEDPFLLLDERKLLKQLQDKLKKDKNWLSSIIRKYLIDNKHCLTLHLLPDPKLIDKENVKDAAKMAALKAKMSKEKLQEIDKKATELKAQQGAPNAPEELATLPCLHIPQIPKSPITLDYQKEILPNGILFCSSDMFTNGMVNMQIVLPFNAFTPEQLLNMSHFVYFATKMGTKGKPYHQVAAEWAALGANMSVDMFTGNAKGPGGKALQQGTLAFSIAGLEESLPAMLDLLQETMQMIDFTDNALFDFSAKELFIKERNNLAYYGHTYAGLRAGAGLTPIGSYDEASSGLISAENNKKLASSVQMRRKLASELETITQRISETKPILVSFVGGNKQRDIAMKFIASIPGKKSSLTPLKAATFQVPASLEFKNGRREGYPVASEVSACVRKFNAPFYWEKECIPLAVFSNILSCGYLWNEIRIKGGAYGTASRYRVLNGTFDMMSAQDPSPMHSFETMDAVPKLLQDIIDEADVEKAIISSVKGHLAPIRPTEVATVMRNFEIFGIDNDTLEKMHRRYLSLKKEELCATVDAFWKNATQWNDCAVGSAKALKGLDKI